MFHLLSLVAKWQSHYENNSKNYYYQKNYFIFKLPAVLWLFYSIFVEKETTTLISNVDKLHASKRCERN
jgi:hypothetical protein